MTRSSTLITPIASSGRRRTARSRCKPHARPSRCSRTTAPSFRSTPRRSRPLRSSGRTRTAACSAATAVCRQHDVTVLDGIKARVGDAVNVVYAEGCKITIGGSWTEDAVVPSDPNEDRRQIAEAVSVASSADVIVLAIGGNEQTSREAWSLEHMGDTTDLELIGRQNELVAAMVATGKPVVALLFNGRPISATYVERARPRDSRVLVPRSGMRTRRGRRVVRGLQSRRQAADHHPAIGRSRAGLLQPQAIGATRLPLRRRFAAVCVRLSG